MTRARAVTGKRLIVAFVVSVFLFSLAFLLRAHPTAATDRRLCNVLHQIIASGAANTGKPGTPGYAYYRAHPDELRAARKANRRTLAQLDCDHLPSGG